MDFIDLVEPEERSLVTTNLERRFAGGADGAAYSFSLVRGDGVRVPVQVHMGLTLLEGDPVIVGILRNMTAEQEAEERARRAEIARAAAEKATKAKSEFLANISHDLRTPLTAVLGFAEQAVKRLDGAGTEGVGRYLSRIVNNAYRLSEVINDVLDLSKIESGQEEFAMVLVDFAKLISDVANDLSPIIEKRELSVVVRCDMPPAQVVVCDAAQISRVVLNLLSNAAKFADRGSVVEIRAWRDEDVAYFSIADEGVDIPADELVKIFEPFTQSSLTTRGRGAPAWALPCASGSSRPMGERFGPLWTGTTGWSSRSSCPSRDRNMGSRWRAELMIVNFKQRHRVLVVDDNRDIRELLGLELQDHQVFFAVDGEEGLAETRRLKPDLVVLDIMMPKLDGFSFLREVERDDGLKFLKVLVLSAKSTKEDLLQGLELGAIDYLTKPFKHDILAAKVDRLLR